VYHTGGNLFFGHSFANPPSNKEPSSAPGPLPLYIPTCVLLGQLGLTNAAGQNVGALVPRCFIHLPARRAAAGRSGLFIVGEGGGERPTSSGTWAIRASQALPGFLVEIL
jgi:hypothetical protein